jgi:hypothetical protein
MYASATREDRTGCGMGFEPALLLLPIWAWRGARARRPTRRRGASSC